MELHRGANGSELPHTAGGKFICEGLQQDGGLSLSQRYQSARERIIADGAAQVFPGGGEGSGRSEGDVCREALGQGSLILRYTDVTGELQRMNPDGIRGGLGAFCQEPLQVTEVRHGHIRRRLGELLGVVVAGQHADTGDADTVGSIHIMLHVADKSCFFSPQTMLPKHTGNIVLLIMYPGVDVLEIVVHIQHAGLLIKSLGVHAGKHEAADTASPAEIKKVACVRNLCYL